MKYLKLTGILAVLVCSMTAGIYWGKHRESTTNPVINVVEKSVETAQEKANIESDAITEVKVVTDSKTMNMYNKPKKAESSKEQLLESYNKLNSKLEKVETLSNAKIDKVAGNVNKQEKNNERLRDFQATLYAMIREEKSAEDIKGFFTTEQAWLDTTHKKACEAGKTGKNVMEQDYYYYDIYNKEIANKCVYLLNNVLV